MLARGEEEREGLEHALQALELLGGPDPGEELLHDDAGNPQGLAVVDELTDEAGRAVR